jgi:hypothetical protein
MKAARLLPCLLGLTLMLPAELEAQHQINDVLSWNGVLRSGYFTRRRGDPDGSRDRSGDLRLRLQVGMGARLHRAVDLKIRFGGRLSTAQEHLHFSIPSHVPATDGLRLGESTLDELHVDLRPDGRWTIRIGRMQTKFERAGVVRKSLDRNDSPSTDITWTDGTHVTYAAPANWLVHGILQHNSRRGPSNVLRAPLQFSDPWSRITMFLGLENNTSWGPVVQRGLDVTYVPRSINDGTDDGGPGGYLGLTGRGAVQWPLLETGTRLMLSGELGYAPRTPTKAVVGTGEIGQGQAGGMAYEASIHVIDIALRHSVGLAVGWIDDGWLISPDYRNNNFQAELRYRWRIHSQLTFEARIRTREDRERLRRALKEGEDTDLYFRVTCRL